MIYTYSNLFIFPIIRSILYFSQFSTKSIITSISCIQAIIFSVFSLIYCWNNRLFISYNIDETFVRYRKDWIIEYMLDLIVGYLISDIFGNNLTFCMVSHHMLGAISFFLIRITGYGYLLALYFMITEITTPFLYLRKYLYKNGKNSNLSDCLIVIIYFLVRILPLPYLIFLLFQIAIYWQENRLMASVSMISVPAISMINIVWFWTIIRKTPIIPRFVKILFVIIYISYLSWLLWMLRETAVMMEKIDRD